MDQTLGTSSGDVLTPPRKGGRSFTTAERKVIDHSDTIKGWGSDLDPSVRPGVPMDKAPGLGIEFLYPDFEQQIPRHKVHKSIEHGKMPPVFGNVCPPRGLSGLIRDFAFRFSEGKLSHWTLLMLADRIDVVEELLIDVLHLRIPNIPREMGLGAEWKYNRRGVIKKAAVVGIGVAAVWLILSARKRRQQEMVVQD